jgi:hypothetical protein
MMMDKEQMQEWARLEQAAAPGEWEHVPAAQGWAFVRDADGNTIASVPNANNAAFICAARTAVPALLSEVERLTAERARLMEAGRDMQEQRDGWKEEAETARAQTDAIAAEWQAENDKLNACRKERDALAGQLAKVRQAYQVYRDSGAGIAGVTFFTFEEWLDYISDSENVPTW